MVLQWLHGQEGFGSIRDLVFKLLQVLKKVLESWDKSVKDLGCEQVFIVPSQFQRVVASFSHNM